MSAITWTLQTLEVSALTDYFKNPRNLTKDQFAQLKKSLDKFGLIDKPIINLDAAHTVIGGHQRLHVLRAEGVKSVECWLPDRELDGKEVEELNIRLNKNTGGWDFDVLANSWELPDLLEWGFSEKELELGGFDMDAPQGEDPGAQIDKAEELRVKWGIETGQLWKLGEHRLICGDCTDRAVVERVGITTDMPLFVDPPYGIGYQTLEGVGDYAQKVHGGIENDDGSLDLSFLSNHERRMVWGFPYIYDPTATGWIVWDKQPALPHRNIVTPIEIAYTTMRKGFDIVRLMWIGYFREKGEDVQPHPTQKPVGVYEPFIKQWTKQGDEIADYFCGSAPVIIACERLSRKCRAVEISPGYVAVALQRWVDMTGGTPELLP